MRRAHALSGNAGGEYPCEVICFDTETTAEGDELLGITHRLYFGWLAYTRRRRGDDWSSPVWSRFTTRAEFWRAVTRRARKGVRLALYCHNAEFDGMVLDCFGELERRGWRLLSACLQGPPTIIKWRKGRRTILLLDTLNYWRLSLAELGKRVGLAKLPMPVTWDDRATSDAYCRRDVEIVWAALLAWWGFLRRHDLGNAAPTLAGQAFNAFRHRFMDAKLLIDCNAPALALAREAYTGGRCECFRLGRVRGPGVVLDVNSMYPAVMRDLEAPTVLLTVRSRVDIPTVERYLRSYALIARVEVATPLPVYPVRVEGRLCFPVGRFEAVLATPELRAALDAGHLIRVKACAIYERAPIFRAFVDWLWPMRQAAQARGDEVEAWQLKILGNSLYGKFGQRGRVWVNTEPSPSAQVRSWDSYDLDRGKWTHFRQIGHTVQRLRDEGEAANSHPAIAAHVTSAARLRLWRLMERAGRGDVWYCDTDSLIGAAAIGERLADEIAPERLGALKLEKSFNRAEFRGLKDYTLDESVKVKGVSRSAVWIDGASAVSDQWQGWAGAIRRGRLDQPATTPIIKTMAREYTKGRVLPSGRVLPLTLTI